MQLAVTDQKIAQAQVQLPNAPRIRVPTSECWHCHELCDEWWVVLVLVSCEMSWGCAGLELVLRCPLNVREIEEGVARGVA